MPAIHPKPHTVFLSANGEVIRAFARPQHPVEFAPSSTIGNASTYAGKGKKVTYPLHRLLPRYSLEQGRVQGPASWLHYLPLQDLLSSFREWPLAAS